MDLISSQNQTKNWRKNCSWYRNGKHNECENYQISKIKEILKLKEWNKTNDRLNLVSFEIKNIRNPMSNDDGFEWTENFDGKFEIKNKTIYFNLKFVCDQGGAQTRTLREVYLFIKDQIEYLLKSKNNQIYFINILDGNTSYSYFKKFEYLINKFSKNNIIKNNILITDLYSFYHQKLFNHFI